LAGLDALLDLGINGPVAHLNEAGVDRDAWHVTTFDRKTVVLTNENGQDIRLNGTQDEGWAVIADSAREWSFGPGAELADAFDKGVEMLGDTANERVNGADLSFDLSLPPGWDYTGTQETDSTTTTTAVPSRVCVAPAMVAVATSLKA
jgi:hypothetical protein